ncbi:MAG: hypothetical protein WC867_01690 [Candidatus Pacearchaeota archaeon]|jgi:hypothetical protein
MIKQTSCLQCGKSFLDVVNEFSGIFNICPECRNPKTLDQRYAGIRNKQSKIDYKINIPDLDSKYIDPKLINKFLLELKKNHKDYKEDARVPLMQRGYRDVQDRRLDSTIERSDYLISSRIPYVFDNQTNGLKIFSRDYKGTDKSYTTSSSKNASRNQYTESAKK